MNVYCTNCKRMWIIASTYFIASGKCNYCGGEIRPILPQTDAFGEEEKE